MISTSCTGVLLEAALFLTPIAKHFYDWNRSVIKYFGIKFSPQLWSDSESPRLFNKEKPSVRDLQIDIAVGERSLDRSTATGVSQSSFQAVERERRKPNSFSGDLECPLPRVTFPFFHSGATRWMKPNNTLLGTQERRRRFASLVTLIALRSLSANVWHAVTFCRYIHKFRDKKKWGG